MTLDEFKQTYGWQCPLCYAELIIKKDSHYNPYIDYKCSACPTIELYQNIDQYDKIHPDIINYVLRVNTDSIHINIYPESVDICNKDERYEWKTILEGNYQRELCWAFIEKIEKLMVLL